MKSAFYESKHGIGADYFTVEQNRDFSFPLHLHRCYEIILLLEGTMRVSVEEEVYEAHGGDMILIKPNRIHSLETVGESRHALCIFSPELIAAVNEPLGQYRLTSPCLRGVGAAYRELFLGLNEGANLATVKGVLYLLCGLFCERLDFTAEESYSGDRLLLRDIFNYVEANVDKPCSLEGLAEELKYAPSYLSRSFSAHVGVPYSTYVRGVKMNRACYLLRNTRESVLDIALRCGFTCLSSFNRCFKQVTGQTPTEYRAAIREEG